MAGKQVEGLFCNMTCGVSLPLELIPKEQVTQEPAQPLPCHPGWQPEWPGQGVVLTWVFMVLLSLHVHSRAAPPASPSGVRCPALGEALQMSG